MKNVLIIIDFQNDFIDGALGFSKAKELENILIEKIKKYDEIIFTLDLHDDDYLNTIEGKKLCVKHCIKGSAGAEIYGKLNEISKNHKRFYKNTFGSLELANYLANKDYENIEIAGLVSNICVLANAVLIKSAKPNANIFIDKNAVASYDEELHNKALDILKNLHINIID